MSDPGQTDKGGRPVKVTDSQILRLFVQNSDPVYSAAQIADELPISKTGVYKRLRKLEDKNYLSSKKIGPGKAWWITDKGKKYLKD